MSFELSPENFAKALNISGKYNREMRHMRIVTAKTQRTQTVLDGFGLPNCFSPLQRQQHVVPDVQIPGEAINTSTKPLEFSFLDLKHPNIGEDCYTESFFKQSEVYISSKCPKDICVNFNDIAPHEQKRFVFDKEKSS